MIVTKFKEEEKPTEQKPTEQPTKRELTEAEKQEAIKYAKQSGALPPNVKVEEVTVVRKEGKETYEFKYKLFIPESVKPQVQAGKEFKSKYVGEIKGFTYNRKINAYVPYTTAVPITEYDLLLAASVAIPFISPAIGGLSAKTLVAGSLANIALGEVFSYATVGRPMTYEQFAQSAFLGQATVGASMALTGGVSLVAPRVVSSVWGRAGLSALTGGGFGYVLSGGDIEETVKGAVFGAGFTLGLEFVGRPLVSEIRARLPSWMPGSVKRLEKGYPTIGKTGEEVDTYISDYLKSLEGKRLRLVADVTEKPIGVYGETLDDLVREFMKKEAATGHATLKPEYFKLKKGGRTVLVGFPEEGMGYRSAKQLYHFYSAPGSGKEVVVYGGYMGIGEGYSGEAPKIVFEGKPTALVTLKTTVSTGFLKSATESVDDYLARVSKLSGQTGIAPETVLGKSAERQFITPAQYVRFGEQLPGSVFVSMGKVGIFQIKEAPKGFVSKIPIVRTMLSKYTEFTVVKGTYKPTSGMGIVGKPLDVPKYSRSYVKSISVSRTPMASASLASIGVRTTPVTPPRKPTSFKSAMVSKRYRPSLPSKPSIPSISKSLSKRSVVSSPSKLSTSPSLSKLSMSSMASSLSQSPSLKSLSPSLSQLPKVFAKPLKSTKKLRGKWFRKTHPIKTEKQMRETFLGRKPRKKKKRKRKSRKKKRR